MEKLESLDFVDVASDAGPVLVIGETPQYQFESQ